MDLDAMDLDLQTLVLGVSAFLFAVALLALLIWVFRVFFGDRSTGPARRGREKRLGVIETASVDAKRKLYLIRRDDVEHLVIIGGPVDVVVEAGITIPTPGGQAPGDVIIARNETRTAANYQ